MWSDTLQHEVSLEWRSANTQVLEIFVLTNEIKQPAAPCLKELISVEEFLKALVKQGTSEVLNCCTFASLLSCMPQLILWAPGPHHWRKSFLIPILFRRGEFRENINPVRIEFSIRMILISIVTTAAITEKQSYYRQSVIRQQEGNSTYVGYDPDSIRLEILFTPKHLERTYKPCRCLNPVTTEIMVDCSY
jgi:hypothetical protein